MAIGHYPRCVQFRKPVAVGNDICQESDCVGCIDIFAEIFYGTQLLVVEAVFKPERDCGVIAFKDSGNGTGGAFRAFYQTGIVALPSKAIHGSSCNAANVFRPCDFPEIVAMVHVSACHAGNSPYGVAVTSHFSHVHAIFDDGFPVAAQDAPDAACGTLNVTGVGAMGDNASEMETYNPADKGTA